MEHNVPNTKYFVPGEVSSQSDVASVRYNTALTDTPPLVINPFAAFSASVYGNAVRTGGPCQRVRYSGDFSSALLRGLLLLFDWYTTLGANYTAGISTPYGTVSSSELSLDSACCSFSLCSVPLFVRFAGCVGGVELGSRFELKS